MTAAEEDRSSGTDWQTCCTLHCAPPQSPHLSPTTSFLLPHPTVLTILHWWPDDMLFPLPPQWPPLTDALCTAYQPDTVFPMWLLRWKLLNPSSTPLWQTHGVRGQPPTSWCGWICRKIMLLAGDLTQEIEVSLRRKPRKRGDRK